MIEPHDDRDNAFWRFSLRVYAAPGVKAECLALQAAHDIDVNLLLFCAWAGAERGWRIARADIERMRQAVGPWQETVVKSLRSARKGIKSLGLNDLAARELRSSIAADEIEAERIEQAMLFGLAAKEPNFARVANPQMSASQIVRDNIELLFTGRPSVSPEALIGAAVRTTRYE
jgi:uncharacterized protein (TIGR02444 family)